MTSVTDDNADWRVKLFGDSILLNTPQDLDLVDVEQGVEQPAASDTDAKLRFMHQTQS